VSESDLDITALELHTDHVNKSISFLERLFVHGPVKGSIRLDLGDFKRNSMSSLADLHLDYKSPKLKPEDVVCTTPCTDSIDVFKYLFCFRPIQPTIEYDSVRFLSHRYGLPEGITCRIAHWLGHCPQLAERLSPVRGMPLFKG